MSSQYQYQYLLHSILYSNLYMLSERPQTP